LSLLFTSDAKESLGKAPVSCGNEQRKKHKLELDHSKGSSTYN